MIPEVRTIETECSSCRGTGIYCGRAEPDGVGVVCIHCGGTGCEKISYKPFAGRKRRNDVKTVSYSRGSFILSCGPVGGTVSYEEFINGKMPQKSRRD